LGLRFSLSDGPVTFEEAGLAHQIDQALLVIQIVGEPTTPALCIAFFSSSLATNDCAYSAACRRKLQLTKSASFRLLASVALAAKKVHPEAS
jgi:hypothetical protein